MDPAAGLPVPSTRPNMTKMIAGTVRLPTNPSGSRAKTLDSTQVSFQKPLETPIRMAQSLIPWPVSFRNTSSRVGISVRKPRT